MEEGKESPTVLTSRRMDRRGMSPTMAAVILVVVIVIVGGAGYLGLNSISGSGKTTKSSCEPSTAPQCGGSSQGNDVVLFVAYQPGIGQNMITLGQGQTLPATVSLSGGESASSFTVYWGDGTNTTLTGNTFSHTYSALGTFVLYATALVNGGLHTGTTYLFPVHVVPTLATTSTGQYPLLTTSFTNGSSSGPNYPWVSAGGTVTVSASYSKLPTQAGYSAGAPSLVWSSGVSKLAESNTTTSVQGSFSFPSPGFYNLTMVGPITGPSGTFYQNYTWSVYVGASGELLGCTNCRGSSAAGASSPHAGSLYIYEIAPAGATTLDPAVNYESVGDEVIYNVYETLVSYNGSSTASFVPVLSTCVPGPAAVGPDSCQSQYGNDLVQGNYWTFPISSSARFYDSNTGASWGVYPSDVMFSIARTLLWLQTPSQYVYNGWIVGQSLLPYGQTTFDGGNHVPWNNTPADIYGSMLVNDSAYCPATALEDAHGCITFDAAGSGAVWPEFLEFVSDPQGTSVVPCGWFTAQGASLPGFSGTNAPNGDGPCYLPGGATNTSQSSYVSAVHGLAPTAFDSLIALGATQPYQPQPQVRWNTAGSGPYYLVSVNQGQGYILKKNPDYAQPNCAGIPGCYPGPGNYAGEVYVFWDQDSTTGVEQYISGQSDSSTFEPTDIPTILNLVQKGKIGLFTLPTLNLFLQGFYLHFDPSQTQSQSGQITNIPADFFSYVGIREFFAQAFPYNTFISVDNSEDGINFIQGVGGAIPQYLGNYYPENITWPGQNVSNGPWPQVFQDPQEGSGCASIVGSACWWWANITDPQSPYFDPEAKACETSTCYFPAVSEAGATPWDEGMDAWAATVKSITNGAIQMSRWDPTFSQIVVGTTDPPGTSPFPEVIDGWLPDYPDPTDYMAPFYLPDGSDTYSAALNETLVAGDWGNLYNGCSSHAAGNFADLAYWASVPNATTVIPQACQGTAYSVMTWGMLRAGTMPVSPERVLYYNLVEHIANGLALYVYAEQQVGIGSYANWINPATIDTNVMVSIPPQPWVFWNGNGVVG